MGLASQEDYWLAGMYGMPYIPNGAGLDLLRSFSATSFFCCCSCHEREKEGGGGKGPDFLMMQYSVHQMGRRGDGVGCLLALTCSGSSNSMAGMA